MSNQEQFRLPISRRQMNATDTSVLSITDSLRDVALTNLSLEEQLEHQASTCRSPEEVLKRMLSIKSVVSTTSSFAVAQEAAAHSPQNFREIGTGSIGKVFEHPGTNFVYKLPMTDDASKLWNNYVIHSKVHASFASLPYHEHQAQVPECLWYGTPDTNEFWEANIDRFPATPEFPRTPRHVLCMERIFPLPTPIRHALIEAYCAEKNWSFMKENTSNKDCLVRPVLGRIKYGGGGASAGSFFTLRNYKLHINQMRKLNYPVEELWDSMAHALAVLHWHTQIDANDVEFVLGSSPREDQAMRRKMSIDELEALPPQTSTFGLVMNGSLNFTKRVTSLWLLDFDDCSPITMDKLGVDKAVKAFLDTNFYCPKPNSGKDEIEELWEPFKQKYLEHSLRILTLLDRPHHQHLPAMFLSGLEQQTGARNRESVEGDSRVPQHYVPTGAWGRARGRDRRQQARSTEGSVGTGGRSGPVEKAAVAKRCAIVA